MHGLIRARAIGIQRLQPRAVAFDPLMGAQHPVAAVSARSARETAECIEQIGGPEATRLSRSVHRDGRDAIVLREHGDLAQRRAEILDHRFALARGRNGELIERVGAVDGNRERVCGQIGEVEPELDRGHRFLERGCTTGEQGSPGDVDPLGECGGERRRKRLDVDGFNQLDVEIFREALVPDPERQPEAHLRPGREAECERERELLDAERALECPRHVAMRHEPHLAELREPKPHGKALLTPHG